MNKESSQCEMEEKNNLTDQASAKSELPFKRPTLLIGKIGRLPRKVQPITASNTVLQKNDDTINDKRPADATESKPDCTETMPENGVVKSAEKVSQSAAQQPTENSAVLPYKEPDWSGLPETSGKPYIFEVLKNGRIIETIDLMKKPFSVFGRLPSCDICMQHPTISRYHAVIQYRDIPSETELPGFYIYDLGSTHGTFLNGKSNKLKPQVYAPIRVGHMIRLGCSLRSYILMGPEDDQEDESELSVTELKQLREKKIKEREEKMRQVELEREEQKKRDEERGIDWGMGDDADAEEDIAENPYASTSNEELYLDDPKKALRGFFEREGIELEYDCSEQGMSQFLCKVELPLDDELGRPIVAEVLHRGKKKEAVVQCALEACRILDRFGVLRQATHESKKRKARNWEDNDYYDSDEDTFLDRTGTIEKKREKRMKVKQPEKVETYEGLVQKEKELSAEIAKVERQLGQAQAKLDESNSNTNTEEDSLDSYMRGLGEDKPDKQTVSKLRLELSNLRKCHANVVRLANMAKPADLPALVPASSSTSTSSAPGKPNLPLFGKRLAVPVKFPAKPSIGDRALEVPLTSRGAVEEEEEESDDEKPQNAEGTVMLKLPEQVEGHKEPINSKANDDGLPAASVAVTAGNSNQEAVSSSNASRAGNLENLQNSEDEDDASQYDALSDSDSSDDDSMPLLEVLRPIKTFHNTDTFKKFENIMRTGLPDVADRHKRKLVKILRKLQRLASNEDRMHTDWKTLSAKKRKVMKWIGELRQSEANEKLEYRVSTELNRILNELNIMTEDKFKVITQVKQMGYALKTISVEIDKDIQELKRGMTAAKIPIRSNSDQTEENAEEPDGKKRKKNQKRNEQRQHKAELERQRGYEEDASRENYNMWVPPNNQSGDGRTSLNEKYGY